MRKKDHELYTRWNGMMARCYYKSNSHYKYYGAKGIKVDERWHDFWNFVFDVDNHLLNGRLLYRKGFDLDKDIKGGNIYSLENCTVVSTKDNESESRKKQQKKLLVMIDEKSVEYDSLADASKKLNIPRSTIISCIKRGNQHKSGYYFKYSKFKG
ncbi:hypothetical protein [Guptibacillus hwajinpoensis]|uniref:hypothetical protein n=1 Tax=Guptibacillus hwajinpoensis TaxID=208199 RepID=UPI003D095542